MRAQHLAPLLLALGCGRTPLLELDGGSPRDAAQILDLRPPPPDFAFADFTLPPDCAPGTDVVYVVDTSGMLSRFHPDRLHFTDVGVLHCPVKAPSTPFSMAVQRDGTAWVVYGDGELFKVSVKDASCVATAYVPGQNGFLTFGMGFAANSPGSTDETLFLAGDGANTLGQLGTLDLQTLTVSVVGPFFSRAELTGTGDAGLWAFFPESVPARVDSIDKQSAKILGNYRLDLGNVGGASFAFAAWGGDFWLFLQGNLDRSTKVLQLHAADGTLDKPIPQTGRTIVGAGVSTCAPAH